MRDLAIELAGAAAILSAIAHSALGERRVFARPSIRALSVRPLMRANWQTGAAAWRRAGALPPSPRPHSDSQTARRWIVFNAVAVLGLGGVANARRFRGAHFGGIVLGLAAGLSIVGAQRSARSRVQAPTGAKAPPRVFLPGFLAWAFLPCPSRPFLLAKPPRRTGVSARRGHLGLRSLAFSPAPASDRR